jgi:nucleoside-diphosphate kinase
MAGNITLTIVKPNALKSGYLASIMGKIHEAGFRIAAIKGIHLSTYDAGQFYNVHRDKQFFDDLIKFMTSGPIVVAILEKENAVEEYRKLIGKTNPEEATDGTIRKLYGESLRANAVHGSDSDENAIRESNFFFSEIERF